MEIKQNYPLSERNTFGIAAQTDWWIDYTCDADIDRLVKDEFFQECRVQTIGEGSNLLFLANFHGILLHSEVQGITELNRDADSITLRVGSGMVWDDFVAYTVEQGYYGAENLSLIPGQVGAAAVQNIGAYGVEVSQLIVAVHARNYRTGETRVFSERDCRYAYRYSIFKEPDYAEWVIMYVDLRLQLTPSFSLEYAALSKVLAEEQTTPSLRTVRDTIIRIRRSKLPDPATVGNAGSFFVNPVVSADKYAALQADYPSIPSYPQPDGSVKVPAGWLIEQCGYKGHRDGAVGVYEHQALVLVNHGGATGTQVAALAEEIIGRVRERFGIELHPEVKYIL
ncbi:UDP-N-acetylmuramate dehydrogenase [Porphyromonas loveana]|uniref:UDP-N-acetylmuramate dehydrogenase n=1 Tax=Porphyromonas loveana TaxID=1884669 RepID=UPI0035A04894